MSPKAWQRHPRPTSPSVLPCYCTLADTDAAPFNVNVQRFALLLVEHAPEKFALRPLPTVSVIDAPTVNDADLLDPLVEKPSIASWM
jgi:hypothetical protein